jgi:DNA-binding transcriptional MerR regulator/methylmalonyl-CoA mutase cobalamin-binding subunit
MFVLDKTGMSTSNTGSDLPGIAAVERDTGLAKDTLRMWERRYGFPVPLRDGNGERVYPQDQVQKLRLIRRLLDNGYRPGKIVSQPTADLVRLSKGVDAAAPVETEVAASSSTHIELLRDRRVDALRRALRLDLARMGLAGFVGTVVAPLATLVGDEWARGNLSVFEEHLFTEQVMRVLRDALNSLPEEREGLARPRVLLTTLPQEQHGVGLLMAESLLALSGCACLPLGLQTPPAEIALATTAHAADIVALSCAPGMSAAQVWGGLADVRRLLPATVELWVGGTHPALTKRALPAVRVLRDLAEIAPAVSAWRQRNPALPPASG